MEFVEGSTPKSTDYNWFKVGKIAALLHNIEDYPHTTLFSLDSVKDEFFNLSRKYSFGNEYWNLVEALPDFNRLPTALIHTDIQLQNTILTKNGNIILTDWDDAGKGPTVLDLGFPLICKFISRQLTIRRSMAASFYQGYSSLRQISDEEKEFIFDAGLFYALLYIKYGIARLNWEKIKYAIRNKELIMTSFNKLEAYK
jgi:hypothetical protein